MVFFSSVLAVLTRNKWVQTQLAQYVATQLQKELGVAVEVKAVEIDFLRNFHLEGVLMRDLHQDTFLYLHTIDFQLGDWNISRNAFNFNKIVLFKPLVKMGYYTSDSLLNYEEIFARLPDDSSASRPLKLNFFGIKIQKGGFVFFDGEKAYTQSIPEEFNPSYLRYNAINAHIDTGIYHYDGSLYFNIKKFNALDRGGFAINELNGPLRIVGSDISMPKLHIETGESIIKGSFSITKDLARKGTYFDRFVYRMNLVNSKIRLLDLGTYAPYLKTHSLSLDVNAQIVGPLSDLRVNTFSATTQNGTRLKMAYQIQGLPNLDRYVQHIQFDQSKIAQTDLQELFQGESWRTALLPFGDVNVKMNCELPGGKYSQNGTIATEAGTFSGLFDVRYDQANPLMPFNCKGSITQLRSQIWSDTAQALDRISGAIEIHGDRFDSALNAQFEFRELSAYFNQKFVDRITIKGNAVNGDVWTDIQAENEMLILGLQVDLSDIYQSNRTLNVKGKIAKIDLFGLGLDTIRHQISGEVNLNLVGKNIDDYRGSLSVDFARFDRGKTEFQLQHQIITRPDKDLLGFKGDWIDGSITGPLQLSNIELWIKQVANSIAPERFPPVRQTINDSVYIDITVPQTAWIEEFVIPGLYLGPLHLSGHYFANQNTFDLQMGPFSLEYGRMYMEKALFTMEKPRKNGFVKTQFKTNYILVENTLYDTFAL